MSMERKASQPMALAKFFLAWRATAVDGDDGEFAFVAGEFDALGDDGVGGDAGAGVEERDFGEFIGGGFVRFGPAIEDEGGVKSLRAGDDPLAEFANGEVADGRRPMERPAWIVLYVSRRLAMRWAFCRV